VLPKFKKMVHFSKEPVELDLKMKYDQNLLLPGKPSGLWLSDETTEYGWKKWCKAEEFKLDHLSHELVVEVDWNPIAMRCMPVSAAVNIFSKTLSEGRER